MNGLLHTSLCSIFSVMSSRQRDPRYTITWFTFSTAHLPTTMDTSWVLPDSMQSRDTNQMEALHVYIVHVHSIGQRHAHTSQMRQLLHIFKVQSSVTLRWHYVQPLNSCCINVQGYRRETPMVWNWNSGAMRIWPPCFVISTCTQGHKFGQCQGYVGARHLCHSYSFSCYCSQGKLQSNKWLNSYESSQGPWELGHIVVKRPLLEFLTVWLQSPIHSLLIRQRVL